MRPILFLPAATGRHANSPSNPFSSAEPRRVNLLFLNPVGVLGGAERILLDLLAVLREIRPAWNLHLIVGTDGPLREEARALGVSTRIVPLPATLMRLGDSGLARSERGRTMRTLKQATRTLALLGAMPGYLRRLRRAVAEVRPALIHSNGIKSHLVAGYAAPRGVPVTWHIHDFLAARVLVGKVLRRVARPPTLAIAISEAVRRDTQSVLPRIRVETVYNGIDTKAFTPEGATLDLAALAGLPPTPEGTLRVGLIGTYARWKGQDVLIDAAARLAGRPLRWYIIGGPLYETAGSQFRESELRERIRERGLESHVGLVPFQRQPPPVYRSLDLVVHASTKPEPFGRTIVESMASCRPTLVANAGGAAELFTHDVDAVGVAPGDPTALADAIATLATDPARRVRLGEAARNSVVTRFSRTVMGARIATIYESLMG